MGWLEKIGLVERNEPATPVETAAPVTVEHQIEQQIAAVDAEIKSTVNIIDDIYSQNGMADKSTSIFTVKALIDTLPPEMTTAAKQGTVAGILAVSGKYVAELVDDANKRLGILKSAQDKIITERTEEINIAKQDIEELKRAIEAANVKIKEAEDIISATTQTVNNEVKIINELVEFCSGMEVAK